VEDPAEAFEDLRDKNDLLMLLGHTKFMEEGFGPVGGGCGKMGPPVDKKWLEKWRKDMKIAGVRDRSMPT
jgi:histone acetyltransferase 1